MAVKLVELLLVDLAKDQASQAIMETLKAVELARAQLVLMLMVDQQQVDQAQAQQTLPETV